MDLSQLPNDYLEAPLEGLCEKPMHLMTIEELSVQVQQLHEYRMSAQQLRAAMGRSVKKVEVEEKSDLFGEM